MDNHLVYEYTCIHYTSNPAELYRYLFNLLAFEIPKREDCSYVLSTPEFRYLFHLTNIKSIYETMLADRNWWIETNTYAITLEHTHTPLGDTEWVKLLLA